jgi:hypothetical protein
MDNFWSSVVAIAAGVIGLAIVATIVGKNAQSSQVISAAGSSFANIIKAATGPAGSGGITIPSVNLPSF